MSWRRASRRSSHQNSPGCTSAASKRLHSCWMGGRVSPHAELSHPPRRRCRRLQSWHSMASKSAHTSSTLSSASCRSMQSGLSSKVLGSTSSSQGSWKLTLLRAPHALVQERLHLGPGVPVARALGADHPVPRQDPGVRGPALQDVQHPHGSPDGARRSARSRACRKKAVTNIRHLEYRAALEEGSERRAGLRAAAQPARTR